MRAIVVTVLVTLGLSACAPQPALIHPTASGHPEVAIVGQTPATVRDALVARCAEHGWEVEDASANAVVCSRTLDGQKAVLAQMLIGNAYSTTPEAKVRYTLYQSGGAVHVTASMWLQTQMPGGQVNRQALTDHRDINSAQTALNEVRAQLATSE